MMPAIGSGLFYFNNYNNDESEVIMDNFELRIKRNYNSNLKWENMLVNEVKADSLEQVLTVASDLCKTDKEVIEIRVNRKGSLQGFYVRGNGLQ